jgi:uncharacterized membrane protein
VLVRAEAADPLEGGAEREGAAVADLPGHGGDGGPRAAGEWTRYLTAWTSWNHVRTLTCLGSAVTFTLALRAR